MKNNAWKNVLSAVFFTIIAMVSAAALSCVWSGDRPVHAAESDLNLVSITGSNVSGSQQAGFTVYVRDGDESKVTIKLNNASGKKLEFMRVIKINGQTIEKDEDFPIIFAPVRNGQEAVVTNATLNREEELTSNTTGIMRVGYDVEAGKSPTFELFIDAKDYEPGEYNWTIQFGREAWNYAYETQVINGVSYKGWNYKNSDIEELYSQAIPIKVVIYNQQGAKLKAGDKAQKEYPNDINALPSTGIDLGQVDLASLSENDLTGSYPVFFRNDNTPKEFNDNHNNTTSIGVEFEGENTRNGKEIEERGAFDFRSTSIYGSRKADLAVAKVNGSSSETPFTEFSVTYDATDMIAGTYTGNMIVHTTPHNVSINGKAGNNTGVYKIPCTITLTGTNPRLLSRATNLTATAANGYVELRWKAPEAAEEYTEYDVYRREGTETVTDPDKIDWSLYEKVGSKSKGEETDMLYMDGDVTNGKTYSYTVIAGDPYHAYAAKTSTATPKATIQSKMLAPDVDAYGTLGGVEVSWSLNNIYGGDSNNGAGMVDYFNVYRDGVLVDRIYQSAVQDDPTEEGFYNNEGVWQSQKVHRYSWTVMESVPQLYQPYTWAVSAVSPSGVESYLNYAESGGASAKPASILSHRAWLSYEYEEKDDGWEEIPVINIYAEDYGYGDTLDTLIIWRAKGTTAPDTSGTPYATCDKDYTIYSGMHDFEDRNVTLGQTYTYAIQGIDYNGNKTNIYTFTMKASEDLSFNSSEVTWSVVNGKTARLQWYGINYDYDQNDNLIYTDTFKVYRNNKLIKTYQKMSGGEYDFRDDPGADGTYIYRVDTVTDGVTLKGREFKMIRNTQPDGEVEILEVPDAPTLTGRTSGKTNVILNWKPAATGGAPEGYHIYRKDAGKVQTGGRYVTRQYWYGLDDEYQSWGNDRYITLQTADELSFVDGIVNNKANNHFYKNDTHLGEIRGLGWENDEFEQNLPHEYYITAYNRAGESAPSAVVIFDANRDDGHGNAIAPENTSEEPPVAPTLNDLWIKWDDQSSYKSGFDDTIYGDAHVAWADSGLGGDIDSWKVSYVCDDWQDNSPDEETVDAYQAILDPKIKLGTTEDSPKTMIDGYVAPYEDSLDGDIGRTITATVTAKNSAGDAVSNEKSVTVYSIPRFYCLPDNGGAVLRWTDLAVNDGSTVSGWEIWRKAAYGKWECVTDSLKNPELNAYKGTSKVMNKSDTVAYHEWIDTDVENGWKYEYKVIAKCNDGIDRPSVVREVTPTRTSTTEMPGTPHNLSASVVNGQIIFRWNAPTSGGAVEWYEVLYQEKCYWDETPAWYPLTDCQVPGDSTGAIYLPNEPGTYKFAVYSFGYIDDRKTPESLDPDDIDGYYGMTDKGKLDAQYPNHSNMITVTVTQEQIDLRDNLERPDAPKLSAIASDGKITLSWAACNGASHYNIKRESFDDDSDGDDYTPDSTVAAVSGQKTYTFVDENVKPGVRYTYTLTAINAAGPSGASYVNVSAMGLTMNERIAVRVSMLIRELPDPDEVSAQLDDEEQAPVVTASVNEVAEMYDGLTDVQKELIDQSLVQKLLDCQEVIATQALRKQYAEVIEDVQAGINDLPAVEDVTLEDEAAIAAARQAYEAIDDPAVKKLIRITKLTAAEKALRDLKYNLSHAEITVTGRWIIGVTNARPTVTVKMNGQTLRQGTDFTIAGYRLKGDDALITDIQNYGTYSVVISAKSGSNYYGTKESEPNIAVYDKAYDLANASLVNDAVFAYSAMAITPELHLAVNGQAIEEGLDYHLDKYYAYDKNSHTYSEIDASAVRDVGQYQVEIVAAGERCYGTTRIDLAIEPASVKSESITVDPIEDVEFTGHEICPSSFNVYLNGVLLTKEQDYTLKYANNISVGTAQVIIEGKGNLNDTRTEWFNILEKAINENSVAAYTELLEELASEVAEEEAKDPVDQDALNTAKQNLAAAGDLTDTGENGTVEVYARDFTFTGQAIVPSGNALIVQKTYNGTTYDLKQDLHYTLEVTGDNVNASPAVNMLIQGIGTEGTTEAQTWGTIYKSFAINQADIAGVDIDIADLVYNGTPQTPSMTIALDNYRLEKDKDYSIEGLNDNTDAGKVVFTVLGSGTNFSGTTNAEFEIKKAPLEAVYAGETITYGNAPRLTVAVTGFVNGENPETADNYTAPTVQTNVKNAGTYSLIPSGGEAKNYYFEYAGGNLIINRRSITAVVLSASSYVYNGGIKRPGVTVKCGATILVNNRDYTCSNVGGKVVGQYKVTVNCKGNYTGSKTAYFSINPKGTKLSKLTKKKKSFTAKWKKQTANMGNGKINGYQIQCSLKKNFASGNKTVTVGDVKKTSRTVKGVKAKKTYYVRIRTYKKVGGKTFYSPWSGVKKVKTK